MAALRYQEDEETTAERAEEVERHFRATLARWNIEPSGDDRVREDTAARLLGFTTGSLANMRQQGRAPQSWKLGRNIFYRVRSLADWLAIHIEKF